MLEKPTPTPVPTATSTGVGYLEGKASIGPLVPVEREGVPTPTPSPEVCTSRGLTVLRADGRTEVTSFNLAPDCTFRVALAPGIYVVRLKQTQGIGGSKELPRTIEVLSVGETVRLDIAIDTGIR